MSWYSRIVSWLRGQGEQIERMEKIIGLDDALIEAFELEVNTLKTQVGTLKKINQLQEERANDFKQMIVCYEEIISIYEQDNPPPKPTLRIVK